MFRKYPDGSILALTGESAMDGTVFVGWTGSPDNLTEVAVPKGQLPPEVEDIPTEWKAALKDKGFEFEDCCVKCEAKDRTIRSLELEVSLASARNTKYDSPDVWIVLMLLSWVVSACFYFVR